MSLHIFLYVVLEDSNFFQGMDEFESYPQCSINLLNGKGFPIINNIFQFI